MPDVYEQAEAYRAELLALDAKAAREMAAAYRQAYAVMQERLRRVTALIEGAQQAGEPVDPAWLFQQDRWREFYSELRDGIERYNKVARGITETAQGDAIDLGTQHMGGLIKSAFGGDPSKYLGTGYTFAKPDDAALRQMVGFTRSGAPLANLFRTINPEAAGLAIDTMRRAITIGQNPLTIARSMQGPLGIPMWRSLTIARTETLRAYREAQRQTVLANADVLEGWTWMSSRDRRTCEVCWAMHGKVFPISEAEPVAAGIADDLPPGFAPRPDDPQLAVAYDEALRAYREMKADGLDPAWRGVVQYGDGHASAHYNRGENALEVERTITSGGRGGTNEAFPWTEASEELRRGTAFHEVAHSVSSHGVDHSFPELQVARHLNEAITDGYTTAVTGFTDPYYRKFVEPINALRQLAGVPERDFWRTLITKGTAKEQFDYLNSVLKSVPEMPNKGTVFAVGEEINRALGGSQWVSKYPDWAW